MPMRSLPDPDLPLVCTAAEAYSAGMTRDQVRQRVRSGRWRVTGHGVYLREGVHPTEPVIDPFAVERHQHLQRAAGFALAFPGSALALHSAAVYHEVPMALSLDPVVALNEQLGRWNGRRPGVVIHRMSMGEDDVVEGRIPVTSVSRTCMDLARLTTVANGLAVCDAAVRAGLTDPETLAATLAACRDRRHVAQAGTVLAHIDPNRESPGESASWAYFLRHGLPLPTVQAVILDRDGRFVARVDVLWEHKRLVGECDGRMKYARSDDVYAEKRREDEVRELGYGFTRWAPADLRDARLANRLRRLLQ